MAYLTTPLSTRLLFSLLQLFQSHVLGVEGCSKMSAALEVRSPLFNVLSICVSHRACLLCRWAIRDILSWLAFMFSLAVDGSMRLSCLPQKR